MAYICIADTVRRRRDIEPGLAHSGVMAEAFPIKLVAE